MRAAQGAWLVSVLAMTAILVGCTATPTDGAEPGSPTAARETDAAVSTQVYAGPVEGGEGALSVLAWPGYAEDGSSDPGVDWVSPFESATGCQVDVTLIGTSDEAVRLMQEGDYDVVSASGDVSLRMIEGGLVQPVNLDLVPNHADVVPELVGLPHNSVSGVAYGVPQGRGAHVLAWSRDRLGDDVDSLSTLFDAASPAAGSTSLPDSPMTIADAAVYLMSSRPELGITNPYALDQRQFDAAIDVLRRSKFSFSSDPRSQIDGLSSGTVAASLTSQAVVASLDPNIVGATRAAEGGTGWSDTWMIATDAPNITCAYRWLDWVLSPEVNAQIAEWVGEAPANSTSCAFTADPQYCTTVHADDVAYWEDVRLWTTPTERCLDGRGDVRCVPYSEWVQAWSDLRTP